VQYRKQKWENHTGIHGRLDGTALIEKLGLRQRMVHVQAAPKGEGNRSKTYATPGLMGSDTTVVQEGLEQVLLKRRRPQKPWTPINTAE
jgi:hypothetical protein